MIKEIPDFPQYFIDDKGNVWTTVRHGSRFVNNLNGVEDRPRLVKGRPGKTGYLRVYMRNSQGKRLDRYVHRLVAEAFIQNPEGKHCVDHIDFNRSNNNVSNLQWVTHKENNQRTLNSGHLYITERGTFNSNYDYKRYSLLPSES